VNEFACLHKFARLNPQFGVYFPLGSRDYPHLELRLPQLHGPGTPPLALPSCPATNASIAFLGWFARNLGHGDGLSVDCQCRGSARAWLAGSRQ